MTPAHTNAVLLALLCGAFTGCAAPPPAARDASVIDVSVIDALVDDRPTADAGDAPVEDRPSADAADASASGWRAEPRLPAVWQEIAGDVIDGRIWIVGGFESGVPTSRVRVYDPATRRWEDGPSLPAQLHHMSAVAVGGDLYAIGGYVGFTFTPVPQCHVLRRGATSWQAIRALPEARGAATAGAIDGRVVVAGGYGASQRLLGPVVIYDPRTDRWSEGAPIPTPREHLASFVHGGKLWVLGGRRGGLDTGLAVMESYDPAADAWRADLPPMRTTHGGFAAAVLDGVAYAMGGERSERALSEVEALDLNTLTWRAAPSLPTPRHGFVAVTAAGRVWAIGGGDRPAFAPTDAVESYAP